MKGTFYWLIMKYLMVVPSYKTQITIHLTRHASTVFLMATNLSVYGVSQDSIGIGGVNPVWNNVLTPVWLLYLFANRNAPMGVTDVLNHQTSLAHSANHHGCLISHLASVFAPVVITKPVLILK